ncbi:hypothetical protein AGMMS49574_20220 [Bacteroidia bacterium]|nr:hypothetical protein AGMMS49574_20220 [Bacteroidia bacterium]
MIAEIHKPVASFYGELMNERKQAGQTAVSCFAQFDKRTLLEPYNWFRGLAAFEWALDEDIETAELQKFFLLLFRSYDCKTSFDLDETDFDWYWFKIHSLFDRFGKRSPMALIEKAMQYFTGRRGYADKEKSLLYLQKAADTGDDLGAILLGYHLYFGLNGVTDKGKGLDLINSAKTELGILRSIMYKGYIAIHEGRLDNAKALLQEAESRNTDPEQLRAIYEQHAYLSEILEQYEEAATYYRKELNESPTSGFAMLRLAYLFYNARVKDVPDKQEALEMIEEAFRLGRTESARSLFYCYFDSGLEWEDDERAIYWLEKGFLYNDMYSTTQLAYLYLYDDRYKDKYKGLHYINISIEMGDTDAMVNKGRWYETGELSDDAEPDYAKALALYEKAAALGNTQAAGYAGRYYLLGLSVDKDTDKAKAYYEKGMEANSPYSLVELAIMYEDGNGVEENPVKSMELLKRAADQDYPHAHYLMGRKYKEGMSIDENPDEAIVCYEKAAEHDHAKAITELGLCYESGYGVESDGKKALEYMLRAAELDYAYAQYRVGYYYMYGLESDVVENNEEAIRWLTKAVDNDSPQAMLEMGNYYLYDYDGKGERQKAYAYYERAARQDYVSEGLGHCFEYGYGVEVNEGEAFKYYLKAAEDGYVRGMYNVAQCYYYGYGVKNNFSEAYRWFNDASGWEHAESMYYKAKMMLAGEGCTQDIPEGISLLRKAAEAEDANAQFELGNCYLTGKGLKENEDIAMEWFEKAADQGHEQALKITGRRRRR